MLDLIPIQERLAMRTAFLAVQDDEEGPSALEQVTLLDYRALLAEVEALRGEVADLKGVMRDALAQGWMDKACDMIQAEVDSWPVDA